MNINRVGADDNNDADLGDDVRSIASDFSHLSDLDDQEILDPEYISLVLEQAHFFNINTDYLEDEGDYERLQRIIKLVKEAQFDTITTSSFTRSPVFLVKTTLFLLILVTSIITSVNVTKPFEVIDEMLK